LILNQPLDDIGSEQAADLLDVDWDGATGMVRSREGAKVFSTSAPAANYDQLFAHSDARLLARRVATLVSLKLADGTEVAGKEATVAEAHLSLTRVGTPAASYTYIADTVNTIKRYDGTDFTSPTATVDGEAGKAMPKGQFVSTWIDQGNRLVVAGTAANGGPNGAISSGSHVWFSDPGNPESFEHTSFVQLNPGDGEQIVACCAWGGEIFVFKETRLFVFYGISPDAEGKPIFNFRTVDLGTRILPPGAKTGDAAVAGGEGVYFVSNEGLWVTTSNEPSLLSDDLSPLASTRPLVGPAASTIGDLRWSHAKGICFAGNQLYVGLGESAVELLLKFDLQGLRWAVWSAALNAMAAWNEDEADHRTRVFFSASAGAHKAVYFFTDDADEDPTVDMEPRWRCGFYDLESADEKTLVMAKLWGTGVVVLKVAEDYKDLDAGTTFALGEAPAIAQEQHQVGQTATLLSHEFSGDAPWSVQRLDRYLRETRVPETQKP
jgi:hypothetical protein